MYNMLHIKNHNVVSCMLSGIRVICMHDVQANVGRERLGGGVTAGVWERVHPVFQGGIAHFKRVCLGESEGPLPHAPSTLTKTHHTDTGIDPACRRACIVHRISMFIMICSATIDTGGSGMAGRRRCGRRHSDRSLTDLGCWGQAEVPAAFVEIF